MAEQTLEHETDQPRTQGLPARFSNSGKALVNAGHVTPRI